MFPHNRFYTHLPHGIKAAIARIKKYHERKNKICGATVHNSVNGKSTTTATTTKCSNRSLLSYVLPYSHKCNLWSSFDLNIKPNARVNHALIINEVFVPVFALKELSVLLIFWCYACVTMMLSYVVISLDHTPQIMQC